MTDIEAFVPGLPETDLPETDLPETDPHMSDPHMPVEGRIAPPLTLISQPVAA